MEEDKELDRVQLHLALTHTSDPQAIEFNNEDFPTDKTLWAMFKHSAIYASWCVR